MKVALKIEVIGLIWVFSSPQHSFVKYERKPPKSCPVTFSRWTWRRYLGSIKTTLSRYQRHHLRNWQLGWSSLSTQATKSCSRPTLINRWKTEKGAFSNQWARLTTPTYNPVWYKTQDVLLLQPFFSLPRQWAILWIQKSLRLSLSNHRNWMPY